MPQPPNELAASIAEIRKSRPVSAELLATLIERSDENGMVPLEAAFDAFLNAVVNLETAMRGGVEPGQDIRDVKVPLTMFGKTYHLSPNDLERNGQPRRHSA